MPREIRDFSREHSGGDAASWELRGARIVLATPLARDFSDLFGPLETTAAPDVSTALTLWQDNLQFGTLDAFLLAVAVPPGAEAVVSEDAGLAGVGVVPVMTAAEALSAWA